jgi:antitoxin (DNA-binding transcriptional repressor) of toxin-antitoxin stability system
MATAIDIRELPARLDEVLGLASAGGEVILLDGSTPRARLVPLGSPPTRTAGLHPGALKAAPDFDAPLPDDFWAVQS